jgi:hypothetical protein
MLRLRLLMLRRHPAAWMEVYNNIIVYVYVYRQSVSAGFIYMYLLFLSFSLDNEQ